MHPIPQAAEPVPPTGAAEVLAMLQSGDLFRYSADGNAPVTRLEKAFAEFMGVPFAVAVNSCSSAIFLSLKALGLGSGEHVLMPAFTFAAVPSAVLHAGCTPVLANIGPDLRLDIEDFERSLTPDIRAVLLSHMRGHTCDMDAVTQLCQARDVPVIEDAAHSLGATWSGQKVGTIGRIGCFSFQSYKLVNAGEGGMLISRDPDLIARAIIMSGAYEHNWKKHEIVNDRFRHWQNRLPLYGLRMNNLSGAVALSQIGRIADRARKGRANHDYLATSLTASGRFHVPAPLPQESRAPDSIQFALNGPGAEENAIEFQRLAGERGVQVQVFGRSRDNARAFWNWGFLDPQPGLSSTREVLERTCDVRLPVQMDKPGLDSVAKALVDAARTAAAANTSASWRRTHQPASERLQA